MNKHFKPGDRVSCNSEAGRVSGRIVKVHTRDVDYKGRTRHATAQKPQYVIKSNKSDHVAMHKGPALRKLGARQRTNISRLCNLEVHMFVIAVAARRQGGFSTVLPTEGVSRDCSHAEGRERPR